ncbi:DUF4135 domain-containing protein [Murimonas intestini]|uniref:Type 2 lantibiotic biosynthesis protein LanM n=1 Tax=Murimonas intestini TaxID=1337051 RepID=A0AB73T4D3_9FIRM|nr:DUF4135 domain-containing protein [Murimonas intestini]MCR1840585.1 DUF4135 domain-containing protein [Murimonas intestini]MCR1865362.1 DUF4135 domain-containing protein [Murimonas intestini]MCR1882927.1 DUF4135 domain-containing protein [Murimonas intestini]
MSTVDEEYLFAYLYGNKKTGEDNVESKIKKHLPYAAKPAVNILAGRLMNVTAPAVRALKEKYLGEKNPLCAIDSRLACKEEWAEAERHAAEVIGREGVECLYEYVPMLRELIPQMTENFVDFMAELGKHYSLHREEIGQHLFGGADPGQLIGIQGGMADLHWGGRCTLLLNTEGGKILYKPRDIGIDKMYYGIVTRLFSDAIDAPRCVAGNGYGFCEFMDAIPVDSGEKINVYYRNLGIFCALMHALGSTDIHAENVLAVGCKPVLVDMETLLQPVIRVFNDPEIYPETEQSLDPFTADLNASLYSSAIVPVDVWGLKNIFYYTGQDAGNLPVWEGKRFTVRGREDIFFQGFREGYRRCVACRNDISEAISEFSGVNLRILLRNTNSYAKILKQLLQPSGSDAAALKERLSAMMSAVFREHGAENMLAAAENETESLWGHDIPCFQAAGNGYDLLGRDGRIICPGFLSRAAVENTMDHLNRLDDKELRFEENLLRNAMGYVLRPSAEDYKPIRAEEPMAVRDAIAGAEGIFGEIAGKMLEAPCGAHSWLMRTPEGGICTSSMGLANGWGGIAMFASALVSVSEEDSVQKKANLAVEEYLSLVEFKLREIRQATRIPETFLPYGLIDGLGGILKALQQIGEYTGKQEAVQIAVELLNLTDKMPIEEAKYIDVYSGAAGLLHTVASVPGFSQTDAGMRVIMRCAGRLIEAKNMPHEKGVLWDTLGKKRAVSGMGHGMAGIGMALMEAGRLSGSSEYCNAAEDALAFEHQAYDQDIGSWPDFRDSAVSKRYMHGLCSGAPGIGLAMLQCIRAGDKSACRREDLERAEKACQKIGYQYMDHICCGNSSVVEFLLENGKSEEAGCLLASMSATAKRDGYYSLMPPKYEKCADVSLFYGYSGIGYSLLHYARPNRINSVIL